MTGRDRYAQCGQTCTTDCGACKGAGTPTGGEMDQTTARKLARQVGGVATQEARNRGRWGSQNDPWVVVVGPLVLHEVPGGES